MNRFHVLVLGLAACLSGITGGGWATRAAGQDPSSPPPPLEAPYIRLQARQGLLLPPGQPLVQDYAVGPSRVLVCVEPVGGSVLRPRQRLQAVVIHEAVRAGRSAVCADAHDP